MNYIKTKFLPVFITLALTGFACCVFASDYKYKILDPKYNSAIENYEYDETNSVLVEKDTKNSKKPFKNALILLVVFGLGTGIIAGSVRVLKKIDKTDDIEELNILEEVFAVDKIKEAKKFIAGTANSIKNSFTSQNQTQNSVFLNERLEKIKAKKPVNKPQIKTKEPQIKPYEQYPDRFRGAAMNKLSNPLLINTLKLANNKGLCLVKYQKEFSLIGYINDEIFILDKFSKLTTNEFRFRFTETVEGKDRYIIRLGDYKSLVEVGEDNMKLLLEL